MPYYGLFSRDLHILDLRWRSPLCSLLFVDITPVCTTFMFCDSQWLMTLLGMPHCGNDVAKDIHCDATMDTDVAICT